MNHQMPPWMIEDLLTRGVLWRRVFGWFVDLLLIALLMAGLWGVLLTFGVLTFGLGLPLLGVLPFVPFCYHMFFMLSSYSATPGQRMCGLLVRRYEDLGQPTGIQALLSTLGYYVTLATSGLLLLVALFTARHRTLHDLVSGLVVVRTRGMEALTQAPGSWNMAGGPHYS